MRRRNEKEIRRRHAEPTVAFISYVIFIFIIAAQRPDVGFIDWLGVRSIRRWYGVRSVYHWVVFHMDTRYSMAVLSHHPSPA